MKVNCGPCDGYGFEREFCGCAFPDVARHYRQEPIDDFADGVKKVKELQTALGWNPRRPKTKLAMCLFRRVGSRLRYGVSELRLFISIGTKLDLMGVDFFFEYGGRVVTVDLTVSDSKPDVRADFVLTRGHFLRDEHYKVGNRISQWLSNGSNVTF